VYECELFCVSFIAVLNTAGVTVVAGFLRDKNAVDGLN
jgi:hypothetical protein